MYIGEEFDKAISQFFDRDLYVIDWPENGQPRVEIGRLDSVGFPQNGDGLTVWVKVQVDGKEIERHASISQVALTEYQARQALRDLKNQRENSLDDSLAQGLKMLETLGALERKDEVTNGR